MPDLENYHALNAVVASVKPKKKPKKDATDTLEGNANHLSASLSDMLRQRYPDTNFDKENHAFAVVSQEQSDVAASIENKDNSNFTRRFGPPRVIKPKVSPKVLREIADNDVYISALNKTAAHNIGGMGHTLRLNFEVEEKTVNGQIQRKNKKTGQPVPDAEWQAIQNQYDQIESFLDMFCPKMSFGQLRTNTVFYMNQMGGCYWEAIRSSLGNKLQGCNQVKDSANIRLCEEDIRPLRGFKFKYRQGTTIKELEMDMTFRRYVQVGRYERRYFKSYLDPRFLDSKTGYYYASKADAPAGAVAATELIYHAKPFGIDYGYPDFLSALAAADTAKGIRHTNRETMNNGGVPKMFIILKNCTSDTLEADLKKDMRKVREKGSTDMVVTVRLESDTVGAGKNGELIKPELEVKTFSELHAKEGMFLNLLASSNSEIMLAYRNPGLLLGMNDPSLNRATAFIKESIAERQVFMPERDRFDEFMNRWIFPEMGFNYWRFVSLGAKPQDTELLIRMLEVFANNGALTPNNMRSLAAELLDEQLEQIPDSWANIPKYVAILQAAGKQADTNTQPGESQVIQNQAHPLMMSLKELLGQEVHSVEFYKPEQCC